jgi:hypothetical protein
MSRSSSPEHPVFIAYLLYPPYLRNTIKEVVKSFNNSWLLPPQEGEVFQIVKDCLHRLQRETPEKWDKWEQFSIPVRSRLSFKLPFSLLRYKSWTRRRLLLRANTRSADQCSRTTDASSQIPATTRATTSNSGERSSLTSSCNARLVRTVRTSIMLLSDMHIMLPKIQGRIVICIVPEEVMCTLENSELYVVAVQRQRRRRFCNHRHGPKRVMDVPRELSSLK